MRGRSPGPQFPVRQVQSFPEGNRREYHAVTRGWVINELFR